MKDGTLSDRNMNVRGLAMQLRPLVSNERELNSLGYLLLNQGNKEDALKIMQFNAQLYPESANALSSLGEAYLKNSDPKSALPLLERSLELNKDPQLVKEILKVLYQAKLSESDIK
jgi:tetratricopeptide (TPR) repeat protein